MYADESKVKSQINVIMDGANFEVWHLGAINRLVAW